jgi:hypothetical protein
MNVIIVLSVIYLLTWLSPTNSLKDVMQLGGKVTPKIGGPVITLSGIGEEMLSGEAPF